MANSRPPNRERDYLRPPQVAEMLSVTHATVITWIRSGMLAASDLALPGSSRPRFFVRREDLDQFIESRAVTPPTKRKARDKPPKRPAGSRQWV